jgi:hypothetical protein
MFESEVKPYYSILQPHSVHPLRAWGAKNRTCLLLERHFFNGVSQAKRSHLSYKWRIATNRVPSDAILSGDE